MFYFFIISLMPLKPFSAWNLENFEVDSESDRSEVAWQNNLCSEKFVPICLIDLLIDARLTQNLKIVSRNIRWWINISLLMPLSVFPHTSDIIFRQYFEEMIWKSVLLAILFILPEVSDARRNMKRYKRTLDSLGCTDVLNCLAALIRIVPLRWNLDLFRIYKRIKGTVFGTILRFEINQTYCMNVNFRNQWLHGKRMGRTGSAATKA